MLWGLGEAGGGDNTRPSEERFLGGESSREPTPPTNEDCEFERVGGVDEVSRVGSNEGTNSLITERMGLIDARPVLKSLALGRVVPVKDQEALRECILDGKNPPATGCLETPPPGTPSVWVWSDSREERVSGASLFIIILLLVPVALSGTEFFIAMAREGGERGREGEREGEREGREKEEREGRREEGGERKRGEGEGGEGGEEGGRRREKERETEKDEGQNSNRNIIIATNSTLPKTKIKTQHYHYHYMQNTFNYTHTQ